MGVRSWTTGLESPPYLVSTPFPVLVPSWHLPLFEVILLFPCVLSVSPLLGCKLPESRNLGVLLWHPELCLVFD